MFKFKYACERDKEMFMFSLDGILNILFGRDNLEKKKSFKEYWKSNISAVNIFPQETDELDESNSIYDNGCYCINLFGYKNSVKEEHEAIHYYFIHEICNSISQILPKYNKNKGYKDLKGNVKRPFMGAIYEESNNGEKTIYGSLFNVASIDMITSMSKKANNGEKIDDIFNTPYNNEDMEINSYQLFTSLTQLAIAAFSNNPCVNYDYAFKTSKELLNAKSYVSNEEKLWANDFLYGILYDPTHIERVFDRYMGEGQYKKLCLDLDNAFECAINGEQIPRELITRSMQKLTDFNNTRTYLKYDSKSYSKDIAKSIVGNYKKVYEQTIKEFSKINSKKRTYKMD